MKRRFNCVGGRVEVARHSTQQRSPQPQPKSATQSRPEPASHADITRISLGAGDGAEQPESPWDRRLRHPWVWAYRRAHSRLSKPADRSSSM